MVHFRDTVERAAACGQIQPLVCIDADLENCFSTISSVLAEAGFRMEDVVRVQYTVTDRAFVEAIVPVLGRHLGAIRPAATMVIAGLIEPAMKIEVEVTALRG